MNMETATSEKSNRAPSPDQEIEKKWLITKKLPDLSQFEGKEIQQGYMSVSDDGTEVRLRKKGDTYTLTVKSEGDLIRKETEVKLSEAQYSELWVTTIDKRVEKIRYEIPCKEHTIELDLYTGTLEGLIVAEVEFSGISDAQEFSKPDWFGEEVTNDSNYKNKNLALNGRP